MSPMAVLVFRFGARRRRSSAPGPGRRVAWPTGRKLGHVAVTGLLMQAVQFCALYLAIQHGAPAVLCAVVVAMNPVATALLAATFLRDRLTVRRDRRARPRRRGGAGRVREPADRREGRRSGGAAAPGRADRVGRGRGLPAAVLRRRRLPRVDRGAERRRVRPRARPGAADAVRDSRRTAKRRVAVAGVVLLNATLGVSLYVRAINLHGAPAVSMLFCVIPAVAGALSWLMLGQRIDVGVGIGLVLGALACWLNAGASRQAASERSRWRPPTAARSRGGP